MMKDKTVLILLITWWLLIFTATSLPGSSLPKTNLLGIDKLVHIVMYGGLGGLLTLFLIRKKLSGVRLFLILTIVCVGYSFIDELHQPLVGRTFSYYDILANVIGFVLFSLIVWCWNRFQKVVKHAD